MSHIDYVLQQIHMSGVTKHALISFYLTAHYLLLSINIKNDLKRFSTRGVFLITIHRKAN